MVVFLSRFSHKIAPSWALWASFATGACPLSSTRCSPRSTARISSHVGCGPQQWELDFLGVGLARGSSEYLGALSHQARRGISLNPLPSPVALQVLIHPLFPCHPASLRGETTRPAAFCSARLGIECAVFTLHTQSLPCSMTSKAIPSKFLDSQPGATQIQTLKRT